jgi:hypothetical protein
MGGNAGPVHQIRQINGEQTLGYLVNFIRPGPLRGQHFRGVITMAAIEGTGGNGYGFRGATTGN